MSIRYFPLLFLLTASLFAGGVKVGQTTARDAVPIVYDVRGNGSATLVFVHCWACDRSFWEKQLDAFAKRYRVISIDLPGHGESGADRSLWTLDGLADDVGRVAEHLDIDRAILVGHSMGGPVSVLAAPKLRSRLLGIVTVDTLHNAEFEPPPQMIEGMVQLYEADFAAAMRRVVPRMFPSGAPSKLVETVISRASASPKEPALALMRSFSDFDPKAALAASDLPIRGINAAPTSDGGIPTEIEINRKYADFDAVLMSGVGHYLMMERPAEFNRHLQNAIEAIITKRGH